MTSTPAPNLADDGPPAAVRLRLLERRGQVSKVATRSLMVVLI
jgi:hypothetical protein